MTISTKELIQHTKLEARLAVPDGWTHLKRTTATVDRLLHHAHICQTSGDSIRLTQALDGKGVQPLT